MTAPPPTSMATVPHAPHVSGQGTPPVSLVTATTPGVVPSSSSYHAQSTSDHAHADNASSSSSSFASNVGNLITSVFVGNVLTVLFLALLWQVLSVASPFLRPITWATFFAVALRVPKDALLSRLKKSLRKTNGLLHLCAMPFTSVYDLVVSSFGSTETNAGGKRANDPRPTRTSRGSNARGSYMQSRESQAQCPRRPSRRSRLLQARRPSPRGDTGEAAAVGRLKLRRRRRQQRRRQRQRQRPQEITQESVSRHRLDGDRQTRRQTQRRRRELTEGTRPAKSLPPPPRRIFPAVQSNRSVS
ncbi:hypothetical protein NFJ02_44g111400 [Pycnococcus provasolii]